MLDFTYCPYVALYFALENIVKPFEGEFAIYAIDGESLMEKSYELLKDSYFKNKDKEYEEIKNNPAMLFDANSGKSFNILWVTEPEFLNPRIEMQKGCFLLSCNIALPIEILLGDKFYNEVTKLRFVTSCSEWNEIYNFLRKMNIDGRTIYGDLKGLSISTNQTMLAYS